MTKSFYLTVIIFLIFYSSTYGDRGGISIIPDVSIYEPKQKVIIGWNGREEILVLSTDMKSSKNTKVVEIQPFPSLPQALKVNDSIFTNATNLIKRIRERERREDRGQKASGTNKNEVSNVQFLSYKIIAQHKISTFKINSTDSLQLNINKSLRIFSKDTINIPKSMITTINSYIKDGYPFFAIDIINLDTTLITQTPIAYKFKTSRIFYPLKISNSSSDSASIDIITFNTNCILWPAENSWLDPRKDFNQWQHKFMVEISKSEVMEVDTTIGNLVSKACHSIYLFYWHIVGKYSSFDSDFILRGGNFYGENNKKLECDMECK